MRKPKTNRKYRLHQKIKKAGFRYTPSLKTVYANFDYGNDNKDIIELQNDFAYQVQLEIPD